MDIDTGMVLDSIELRKKEIELEETNLYSKVDVFTLNKTDGVELFIIVQEKLYTSPGGGGMWYSYKYGNKDLWLKLELGLSNNNFRGMMENFNSSISVWDWRSISFSWSKPLLPSDFFITISSGIDYYPDLSDTTDHFVLDGRFRFGRKINNRTKVSLGLNPTLRKDFLTVTDTLESSTKTKKITIKNYELFGSVFWISDYRKPYYDTRSGWLGYTEIKSNHLYSGIYDPFIQFTSNLAFYHNGILPEHTVAYRVQSVFRNKKGGPFHAIQLGGNGSLRGYPCEEIGLKVFDNSILLSMEYRFALLHLPPISIPMLSKMNKAFSEIRQRIDGALILDYGRVSDKFTSLLEMSSGHVEDGAGIGFGIRLMILNIERSLAMDIVWGKDNNSEKLKFKRTPTIHTYIDLYF